MIQILLFFILLPSLTISSWAQPEANKNVQDKGVAQESFRSTANLEQETDEAMKQKKIDHLSPAEVKKLRNQTKLNIVLDRIQPYIDRGLNIPQALLDEQKKLEIEINQHKTMPLSQGEKYSR